MTQGRTGVSYWNSSLIGAFKVQLSAFPLRAGWALFIPGVLFLKGMMKSSPLLIILLWGLCHSLAYFGILKVPIVYFWYHTPTFLGWLILLAIGIHSPIMIYHFWKNRMDRRQKSIKRRGWYFLSCGITIIIMAAILWQAIRDNRDFLSVKGSYRYPIYREIAEWLNENSSPEQSVAIFEIGVVGYYCNNQIVDLCNLINKDKSIITGNADYLIIENWLYHENQFFINRNYIQKKIFSMKGFPTFYCYKKTKPS